jgi:hypothetical protein
MDRMTNRIRLPWKRHSKGYEIIHFDANVVDWKNADQNRKKTQILALLPHPMPPLPDDYGGAISHDENDHPAYLKVINPLGNKTEGIDPIATLPSPYLEFANTDCSSEGVLKFATQYGLLKKNEGPETLDMWCYHIRVMHHAIMMWKHVQDDKPTSFAKIYKDHCPYSDEGLKYSLAPVPSDTSKQPNELHLVLEPINLLAALWFQFAGAIDGATSFSPCQECSAWIDTVPGSNRPDKIYCSDACRMRAYRKRKVKE